MNEPVAILLPHYNMPERADHLYEWVEANVRWPHHWVIVDDGSDMVMPSDHTTIRLRRRQEFIGATMVGLAYIKALEVSEGLRFGAYWMLTTSIRFPDPSAYGGQDILEGLMTAMRSDAQCVGVHPSLIPPVDGLAWTCMLQRGGGQPRRVWGIDNTASLVDASWWDAGDWLDPRLQIGWGLMLDACYQGRRDGRTFYVHDGFPIHKDQGNAEKMGRRGDRERRCALGGQQMHAVLTPKYGPDFCERLGRSFTTPEMF